MSDNDFMKDSDEEYDFEYEDDDDDEDSGNVDIENKYYTAKALKSSEPKDAIKEFLEIPPLEAEKGEWGFKALKQAIKTELKSGVVENVLDHYIEFLTYVKSAVSRNYAEKSINSLLDLIEKVSIDNKDGISRMSKFYSLTLDCLQDTKNERLWIKASIKLARLLLINKDYQALSKTLKELRQACQSSSGSEDANKANYMLEIYAIEIQMAADTNNTAQLKDLYKRAMAVRSAVTHPKVMGVIRECGGKMYMSEENWQMAQTEFFQAFHSYDEAGSMQRFQALKYLLLVTMLAKSEINPFESQETKPYRSDPRIQAMTNLVEAYQRDDIQAYTKVLADNKPEIMSDVFIRDNIDKVTRNLRAKRLVNMTRPYTRMSLSRMMDELKIPREDLMEILSYLIMTRALKGSINQELDTLEMDPKLNCNLTPRLNGLVHAVWAMSSASNELIEQLIEPKHGSSEIGE